MATPPKTIMKPARIRLGMVGGGSSSLKQAQKQIARGARFCQMLGSNMLAGLDQIFGKFNQVLADARGT